MAWLSPLEVQAANWLIAKTQAVAVAQDGTYIYSYRVRNHTMDIIPQVKDGELSSFSVKVTATGSLIEENGGNLDLSKADNIKKVGALMS